VHSTTSAERPAERRASAPTIAFLLGHPAHFIALGFGAGLARIAPGTFGTLVALPIGWLLHAYAGNVGWLLATAALTLVGVWAAQRTGRDLGVADHRSIVIDETAAFLFVLYFTGTDPVRQALAFLLFRLFDIAKPPPIRQLDAAMKNGLGVVADDFLAAAYTLLVLALGVRLFGS
jgi:phosphatidylglycerophosphatase A